MNQMDAADDRSMRRTRAIVLTIVGAGLGLTLYNSLQPSQAETRNVYGSREDCEAAHGAAECEPAAGRNGFGYPYYFGPLFLPGQLPRVGAPLPPGAARPVPVAQVESRRGGFGGSPGAFRVGT